MRQAGCWSRARQARILSPFVIRKPGMNTQIIALNNATPPNGPSKTGNPSGGGRGNNPPKGK